MKKTISLTLAMVMFTVLVVPMTVSALSIDVPSHTPANISFSNFTTANSPAASGWNDALGKTAGDNKYAFDRAGEGGDFTPVKGMFGKLSDDTSVKLSKFNNDITASIYAPSKRVVNGGLGVGDIVVINYNMAFGDKNADRYTYAEFYKNQSSAIGDRAYFFSTELASFPTKIEPLLIGTRGNVALFGKTLSKEFHYDINKWYNFEIRITNGDADAQVYCLAELYIDGIKFGDTYIKPNTSSAIYRMNGIADFYFYVDKGHKETLYLDDLQVGFFRSNASNDMFTEMHQSFELTSKSDAYVTDAIHIDLKNDMTVEEFLADVSYNGRTSTQTGITEVKVLKNDWTEAQATDIIEDGWYARVKVSGDWSDSLSRNVYRYYYRKFSPVTYYENNYETGTMDVPGLKRNYNAYAVNVNTWGVTSETQGLSDSKSMYATASNGTPAATNSYLKLQYYNSQLILSEEYVVEISVLRKNTSGSFPNVKYILGSFTVLELSDDALKVGSNYHTLINKTDSMTNKWIHTAIAVKGNEAKLYVNGEYTGITYSQTAPFGNLLSGNGMNITTSASIPESSGGSFYADNFKVYSGSYKPVTLEVKSENYNTAANETITAAGNVTVDSFKAATGAVSVYNYADGNFTAEVTEGNIADGQIAVFKDVKGKVRYFDVELLPVVSDVVFTEENGKVTATVTVENRNAKHVISSGLLVVANRSDNEVFAVNLDKKSDISALGTHSFEASVDYKDGENIIAYFWDKNLKPFDNSKAVYTK